MLLDKKNRLKCGQKVKENNYLNKNPLNRCPVTGSITNPVVVQRLLRLYLIITLMMSLGLCQSELGDY